MHIAGKLTRSIVFAMAVGMPWLSVVAQTLAPSFAETYTLRDLGTAPGVPTNFGGLFILPEEPGTLYLAGSANQSTGALYAVPITRDASGLITGFAGPAAYVADAPYNDGGIVRDPGGLVSYAEWPTNAYAQIDIRSGRVVNRIPLDTFGVVSASAAVAFIPGGYPGAGGMRIVSWSGGQFYQAAYTMNGRGVIDLQSVAPLPGSQLPGGPEGWAYVPLGSPQFSAPSMIVSEYSANSVAVYEMDANGNPVIASRRLFLSDLSGAEGAAIDPVSGSFLFSTFGGSNRVIVVHGFAAPPSLSLSTASLDFGSQTVNTASATRSVTVTNTGTRVLEITTITVAGDFGFTGCATPITLAPGASCTLAIKFFPTSTGAHAGSVNIASNASGSPHVISLAGTGTLAPVPGIALAPSSVTFGAITVGARAVQVLALSNPGTATLELGSISVTDGFFTQNHDCPPSLAPSAACSITVTYAPSVAGSHSGELHIISNAVPSPLVAALSGTANPTTAPGLQLSASSVTFAPQFPRTTSGAQSVTLTSSGTAPLVIAQVAASGDFSFSGCGPSTLAPGATCSFAITFRPLTEGPHSGAIVITSNAPGSPHTLLLSGTGSPRLAPEISLAPSDFAFGAVRTQRAATLTSRLTNAGAAALEISQISSSGSFFAVSHNCPASLAIGAFCDITVTYAPAATGPHSGQLVILSNALPNPYIAALSGTGIDVPPPFLDVDGALDFGQQVTGVMVRRTLTLANTGGDPLTISQMTLIGSSAFGLEGACATIAPERSCDIVVTFTPVGLAAFTARLDIVSNHSAGVVQVGLSGVGTALPQPALELSVGALGFGSQGVGSTTASQHVRLTSIGAVAARIDSIGASLPDFIVNANQCPAVLPPQQSCEIGVAFKPVAPGGRQGSLVIQSNAVAEDGRPHSVSLIGVGCRFFTVGSSRNPQRLCAP